MIDPGALGTLVIGLRAAREGMDEEGRPSVPSRAPSSTRLSVRAAFGRVLRLTSNPVEPVDPPPMAVGCGE